jgi:hypothetical protein
MNKRFKTRDELRETGWTFEKNIDGNFVFVHPNSMYTIGVDMLKSLTGLSEEACKTDYGYDYDDNMFIVHEDTPINKEHENILKKILTETEYRIYLKAVVIENVMYENYETAKVALDELLA